eukprot:TRINITY_DN52_c0_g1_i4.p1 TRINITY_DN52_c0_g1~~TRINITY_DN52_c0_g1_i4.p1  ORF type:complete len:301 (-),score=29.44 TRINITY_DN52_c0_g1_i4:648-1550(-)
MVSALVVCAIFLTTWGTLSGPALAGTIDLLTESSNIRSVTDGAEDGILKFSVQEFQLAGVDAIAYHFPTFPDPPPGIDLSGSAAVVNGKVRLVAGRSQSAGYLLTKAPISFYNFNRGVPGIFGTSFTYQFITAGPRPADGFTFILTADQNARGGVGGLLGYANSGNNQSVAIEFDIFRNAAFGDPNDNHIGFDALDSVRSIVTTATNTPSLINLVNRGQPVYVWIQFWPQGGPLVFRIQIFISTTPTRPPTAVLEVNADLGLILSRVTSSELFVGFTASSGATVATLDISDWAFFSATFQ